jgi:hypothetical protein
MEDIFYFILFFLLFIHFFFSFIYLFIYFILFYCFTYCLKQPTEDIFYFNLFILLFIYLFYFIFSFIYYLNQPMEDDVQKLISMITSMELKIQSVEKKHKEKEEKKKQNKQKILIVIVKKMINLIDVYLFIHLFIIFCFSSFDCRMLLLFTIIFFLICTYFHFTFNGSNAYIYHDC